MKRLAILILIILCICGGFYVNKNYKFNYDIDEFHGNNEISIYVLNRDSNEIFVFGGYYKFNSKTKDSLIRFDETKGLTK